MTQNNIFSILNYQFSILKQEIHGFSHEKHITAPESLYFGISYIYSHIMHKKQHFCHIRCQYTGELTFHLSWITLSPALQINDQSSKHSPHLVQILQRTVVSQNIMSKSLLLFYFKIELILCYQKKFLS